MYHSFEFSLCITTYVCICTGGDGKLKCECSRSLCDQQTWCFTNYKCFQDVKFESNFHHTRLGCIEAIREVNLDGIGVCNGALDTDNYKIQCCDSEDMCNRHLDVAPGKEDSRSPTDTGDPLPSKEALLAIHVCMDLVTVQVLTLDV